MSHTLVLTRAVGYQSLNEAGSGRSDFGALHKPKLVFEVLISPCHKQQAKLFIAKLPFVGQPAKNSGSKWSKWPHHRAVRFAFKSCTLVRTDERDVSTPLFILFS